ncbi:Putative membrane protein [Salinisphaera shabanensis E1L3A]|jgi:DedD protein|uniref:Membrane protein n=2 Tax=Salinisphaera shabanensis TaxID=180542 RepID=U2FXA8_9GAMM|nr:Putative membrane protein [Salinisphaera shabanensis E1L3A]|tara:strand:- start:1256 stop:1936 length:681 start_codon:yes stop_codon:yes gene_type:complete
MKDVMKKRVVGAAVLVVLGIALPLMLARCMQGGDGDTEAMRVYEVAPDGEARPANANDNSAPDEDNADSASGAPAANEREAEAAASEVETPDLPDAVSPNSVPERTPVESVRAPEPEPEPAAETPSEPAGATAQPESSNSAGSLRQNASFSGGYVVQVASFRDEASAEKVARELNSEFKAFYRAGDVNGTTYYRVRIGPFENEAAANTAAAQLRRAGRATLVRRAE